MKSNINPTVLLFSLIFSLIITTTLQAQKLTKTYSKEMAVEPFTNIKINHPHEIVYSMNGAMSSNYEAEEGYVLRPGTKNETPCLIIKEYTIHTWDQNVLKQEVNISVLPEKGKEKVAQEFINQLKIELPAVVNNRTTIDGNMNIEKMELMNGWFRRDRNTFILNNGKSFDVQQVIIESKLYVPKKTNIEIESDRYLGLKIEDLEGLLKIHADFGFIKGGNLKSLQANITYFKATFKEVESVILNARNSEFQAQAVGEMTIGSLELLSERSIFNPLFGDDFSNSPLSFANKYRIENIERLTIKSSGNDQFNLGNVVQMEGYNLTFSSFFIKNLDQKLSLKNRNGEMTVYQVNPDFERIEVGNKFNIVELNLQNAPNFQLFTYKEDQATLRLADGINQIPNSKNSKLLYQKGQKGKGGVIDLNCAACTIIVN